METHAWQLTTCKQDGISSIIGDIYGHTSDAITRTAIDGLSNHLGV
jgi:hypothetical protein